MNRLALTASMLLAAAAALAQTEGVADYKISGPSMNGTGRLSFSKAGFRADWNMDVSKDAARRGGRGPREMKTTMVGKLSEPDVVYTVNDETKSYAVWNTKEAREEAAKSKEKYTVEKLGADTVAGFACQNARIKSSSGSQMEVCATKEIAAPASWLSAMNRRTGGGGFMGALRDSGVEGFPIRWVTKDDHGGAITMEMTKFEKKPVPASTFEIPAGYEKRDAMSVGMSAEQRKQMDDALKNMTPEQRKQYEEMMKKYGQAPPKE
jgi:hypothetical protein